MKQKLFGGYETVFVVGDNDIKEDGTNPGAEFAKRVANDVMNSTIVTLPPGMDINDYYLANGEVATRALLTGEKGEQRRMDKNVTDFAAYGLSDLRVGLPKRTGANQTGTSQVDDEFVTDVWRILDAAGNLKNLFERI